MTKRFFIDAFVWGFVLWLIGYVLGILFFAFMPLWLIGWIITPIGIVMALWILLKKVKLESLNQYFLVGVIWVLIAIICDYFFLVEVFKPADGYYKLDVYLYYTLTFILPLIVGWRKRL